jgi:hypothetical protein
MRARRLDGEKLERAIDEISDENVRNAIYELLLRAREAVQNLDRRVAATEPRNV